MSYDEKLASRIIDDQAGEIERLRAALIWVGQVRPGKNPESGGAIVHMTWEEFNRMREAIGLKAVVAIRSREKKCEEQQ